MYKRHLFYFLTKKIKKIVIAHNKIINKLI
jgi:hypothetical protein